MNDSVFWMYWFDTMKYEMYNVQRRDAETTTTISQSCMLRKTLNNDNKDRRIALKMQKLYFR